MKLPVVRRGKETAANAFFIMMFWECQFPMRLPPLPWLFRRVKDYGKKEHFTIIKLPCLFAAVKGIIPENGIP